MLEWAATLLLHMAPNVQAWTGTVEIMLKWQGYVFETSNSFRRCFNNALVHYQLLIGFIDAEMRCMTDELHAPSPVTFTTPISNGGIWIPSPVQPDTMPKLDDTSPIDAHWYCSVHSSPTFSAPGLPSYYLQSRCPCCFSGSSTGSGLQVDCIVSLNANFQLKQIQDYDQHPYLKG